MGNRQLFEQLLARGEIRMKRGAILDQVAPPKPDHFDFKKVEGMMVGLAVGDALGNRTEGKLPGTRYRLHGEIKDYLPGQDGRPSDDTQLAFWTLEQMIDDRRFVPENVAKRFCKERIYGIGSSVKEFCQNMKNDEPWHRSGPESAGNGALMRIAPMVIPHLKSDTNDLWIDTALSAMITHNDSVSISACISFVAIVWELLDRTSPPDANWWLDTYLRVARQLETEALYTPRCPGYSDFNGSLCDFLESIIPDAYKRKLSPLDAFNAWYSGAYLLETVPCVLYLLMLYGDDPEEAIVRAVNDTKDNDTVAAIVGAAVGALHGKDAIPGRWIERLPGRTGESDDGRIYVLLEQARTTFWY